MSDLGSIVQDNSSFFSFISSLTKYLPWIDNSQSKLKRNDTNIILSKDQAKFRSKNISDVSYLLLLDLTYPKIYYGKVKIQYKSKDSIVKLFLEWGGSINIFKVNDYNIFPPYHNTEHKLYIPESAQRYGQN